MMDKIFTVPTDLMAEFSDLLSENELANEISGSTEEGDVVVVVRYRTDQKGSILDLIEWLDENTAEDEDEEEEDGDGEIEDDSEDDEDDD
jgi:hypothetical protein